MSKNVQIPMELFEALCAWHLEKPLPADLAEIAEIDPQAAEDALADRIAAGLNAKYAAVERRRAYSTYKDVSQPMEARERARNAYLDDAGIAESFRW